MLLTPLERRADVTTTCLQALLLYRWRTLIVVVHNTCSDNRAGGMMLNVLFSRLYFTGRREFRFHATRTASF